VLVLDGRLGASCGDDRVTVSSLGSRDISTITVTGRANPLDVADRQLDLEADKFLLASCHNILEQEYLVTVPESAAAAVAVPVPVSILLQRRCEGRSGDSCLGDGSAKQCGASRCGCPRVE